MVMVSRYFDHALVGRLTQQFAFFALRALLGVLDHKRHSGSVSLPMSCPVDTTKRVASTVCKTKIGAVHSVPQEGVAEFVRCNAEICTHPDSGTSSYVAEGESSRTVSCCISGSSGIYCVAKAAMIDS